MGLIWFLIFFTAMVVLAYNRASLSVWAMSVAILLVCFTKLGCPSQFVLDVVWIFFLVIFTPLLVPSWRRQFISLPILTFYRKVMPTMSRTEREALAAGSVTWEGQLFCGNPNWHQLLKLPKPTISAEEKAFIDGPVETLCRMINDWDITHNRADLPPEMWQFIKEQGFFGLIIPKEYGGKEFSATVHSQILTKLYGKSATVATTVSVPNSLGPAELLLHYGTPEQKKYYLPRLAKGEEVPCFALTGPDAGSDAGAMPDNGIVCKGEFEGKEILGIRLNFDKRYITLAPVATVVGLAFKLYDPDHLLGEKDDLGITCALIPRNTPGITIGRRHFPINIPFQNGPIHGKDVFIPLDWVIGGREKVGHGWRMLMECLAAGRAISLPSSSIGGAKMFSYATGAYSRIRRQFNTPIGRFEGVEEVLARIVGYTYIMDATRLLTSAYIDAGEKPAVASAITKYHVTEMGRKIANDAMDIHGGKGICLGPKNYLGRAYESVPISITVEGANILTRSMIIFGQGAMRCHPYVYKEFEAARNKHPKERLYEFDKAVIGHAGYTLSNLVRSFVLGLTSAYVVIAPKGPTKRYYQYVTRFSSAFALVADVSMFVLGGSLKRKESLSGRLGDILSYLYLLSATLKHFYDQGSPSDDLPLVDWAAQTCLYETQERFHEILQNFPNKMVAYLLRFLIFPLGMNFVRPSDRLGYKVAQLVMEPTSTRDRLTAGAYIAPDKDNAIALLEDALVKTIAAEPVEKIIKAAAHDKTIAGYTPMELARNAQKQGLINKQQYELVVLADEARHKVIAVDDFAPNELARI